MKSDKKTLLVPLLTIGMGTGWLLTTLEFIPKIDWVWTLGLAAVGVATFAIGGFDKVTAVVGPFFIVASGLSLLRQVGALSINVEVPILVILSGVLLLIARSPKIPIPAWLVQDGTSTPRDT